MTATLRPRRLVAPPVNRLVAASIDLAIIVLPTVAIALLAAERFTLIGPDGAPSRFSVLDQARLDEIDGGLHRAVEIGGSLFTLDLAGLLMTTATMTLAALLAHVAFPVLGGGRSPGKAVTGLRVVAEDGGPVGVGQHLIRTLAGPIDLLGLGVPGLLGTLLAWSDVDRRRLGDRLAETRVSGRPIEWMVGDSSGRRASADRSPTATPASMRAATSAPTTTPVAAVMPAPTPAVDPAVFPSPTQEQQPWPQWLGACAMTEVPVTIVLTGASRPEPALELAAAAPSHSEPLHSDASHSDSLRSEPFDPDPSRPAPPLPPIRRLDGSPTRSPRSRRGAIRAEIETRIAPVGPRPEAGWLGGSADYDGWVATGDSTTGTRVGRGTESRPTGPYDTLLFPESSLAEGASAATMTRPDHNRADDLT